jgi:hypothetical protein
MKMIRIRISARHAAAVAGLVVAGSVLAACGGGSSGGATPVGAAASASPTAAANNASAYRTCLAQHGVNLPSRSPGQGRPSGGAGNGGGFGGFGGGGGGGFSVSPQMQAAMQACASLRPSGGAFPGGGRGGTALVAFRNCMNQQGVAIPTTRPTVRPTVSSTDGSRFYLGGLDPNDPKVSAALKVCSPLLPSRGASAQPTG